jgi:hypothetical protein
MSPHALTSDGIDEVNTVILTGRRYLKTFGSFRSAMI